MIAQQINLYQDGFKQNQSTPQLNWVLAALGGFILVLTVISVFSVQNLHQDQAALKKAKEELAAKQAQVKSLTSKLPSQKVDPLLEAEIVLWENRLVDMDQILSLLNNDSDLHSQGFSAYFLALANQPATDIWLSRIHLDAKQHEITLKGSTLKADKIPLLLQQLENQAVFHGYSFATLEIETNPKEPNLMNFKLSSQLPPAKKQHVQ